MKKQNDSSRNVLDAFEEKICHLRQTLQNLNEKFNERNKIEVYLSKNGKYIFLVLDDILKLSF